MRLRSSGFVGAFVASVAAGIAAAPSRALSASLFTSVTGGNVHEDYGSNPSGFDFTPNQDVYVTALGYYSGGPDETSLTNDLHVAHEVQIFDLTSHNAVTEIATITPSSLNIGQFSYEAITPVLLLGGTEYAISGTQEGPAADGGNIDPIVQDGTVVTNPLIYINGGTYYSDASTTPQYPNANNLPTKTNLGPTFEVAPVPEPVSMAMMGIGGMMLLARRRRIA